MGASDEDIMDLVNTFPLASKHIHTLSLRCSCITDRGLESLLDHLQVNLEMIMFFVFSRNKSGKYFSPKCFRQIFLYEFEPLLSADIMKILFYIGTKEQCNLF